ncbi:MAG: phosphatidate cytidylyltransferase [candidate division Zixibacteria bacterium]|nr:phosphatidate cytidylyltransferase [candidate division Zixibacteria bacterium]MDH3938534.1 phosphatidate cytidylyltransferase [candidate division Zixibacteria bacterium]MDH4035122.1 phosphatidate cytidylyltransferase [candidate division Zixibacteria bacterium]
MSRNLILRISVAAVAIPGILWACYRGGDFLHGLFLAFALVAIGEYLYREGYTVLSGYFWLSTLCVTATYFSADSYGAWHGYPRPLNGLAAILIFFIVTALMFSVRKKPPGELFIQHTRLVWGVAYIGLLYPFVRLIGQGFFMSRDGNSVGFYEGGDYLLFLFGLLWVGDTAAMGIGKWLGRLKLAPTVSPNKTVEGFIGGIVGALTIGVLMYFWRLSHVPLYHLLICALGCSLFGQLGDLVESMWKRSLDIKDSSNIIPGHGGVLDRFDSLLFAAPFMYVYMKSIH